MPDRPVAAIAPRGGFGMLAGWLTTLLAGEDKPTVWRPSGPISQLRSSATTSRYGKPRGNPGWGKSTIARALKEGIPKLDLVIDVLTAAGVPEPELEEWKERHQRLAVAPVTPASEATTPTDELPQVRQQLSIRRRWLVLGGLAIALVASALSVLVTLLLTRQAPVQARDGNSPPASRPMAIEVQNKVALGASDLREDSTPAYISTRTVGRCARLQCKLDNSEVGSGALLVATCQTVGAELVNFNLDAPQSATNPHAVRSALWYRITLPDGRNGYLSEVYVLPRDRGGLGLPTC